MEQIMIYDYLGNDKDPVLQKLVDLKKGESIALEDMKITLNTVGLYEVSTDDTHDCFSDMRKCYNFICDCLKDKLLSI